MTPENLFQMANPAALLGWLALAFSPKVGRSAMIVAGTLIPLLLAVGYTALVLAFWSSGEGGFNSLAAVAQLMQNPWLLLAGWLHYLAFDLLMGAWELRTAQREGIAHHWVLPCLALTFFFGPVGFLAFQGLRFARSRDAWPMGQSLAPRVVRLGLRRLEQDSPRYMALALFLVVVAIPMLGAWALDDRLFQGIAVWIKPLKFSWALILYLLTLAWFARYAPPAWREHSRWVWHEQIVVGAVIAEMLWIVGAAALGVGSHFNQSTPLMGALYGFMGLAAIVLTSATTSLALAIHRNPQTALSPPVKAGLVWGLGLTLPLTLITAGTMSAMGGHWVGGVPTDAGGVPVMGWARDGGDLRVAHFFATHAMHVIPLLAWALSRLMSSQGGRTAAGAAIGSAWAVRGFGVAYAAFVLLTFVQALMGLPFLAA